MSRKVLNNYKLISAGSMASTLNSVAVNIEQMDNIAIQVNVLTGTATGALNIQVSLDYKALNGVVVNAGNWISLGSPYTQAITSGAPANTALNVQNMGFPWIRLNYTSTSGSGTFDAFIGGKGWS